MLYNPHMVRRAVIIASPLIEDQRGYLPGVGMDVVNYKAFLTSPVGGSWLSNEIIVLKNPTGLQIKQAMNSIRADYVFTAYSGHGGTDINTWV